MSHNSDGDTLIQEAVELLDIALTVEELERLRSIKYEVNNSINWKELVDFTLSCLTEDMHELIHTGIEGFVKRPPLGQLFPVEKDFLSEGRNPELYEEWLTLMLVKKLLGAMKTKVKKRMKDIPTLDNEEEMELQNLVDGFGDFGPEDEEEDGVLGLTSRPPNDEAIIARLHQGKKSPCKHTRTQIRQIKANKRQEKLQVFCRDCREIVEETLIKLKGKKGKKAKGKTKPVEACKHNSVRWVRGQEGQTAECAVKNGNKYGCGTKITDPNQLQNMSWARAGLEPYGDDPLQDEVIVI